MHFLCVNMIVCNNYKCAETHGNCYVSVTGVIPWEGWRHLNLIGKISLYICVGGEIYMNKERITFISVLGILIIVIGAIGFVATVAGFDYAEYSEMKEYADLYDEELEVMKGDLQATWIMGVFSLVGSVIAGVLLMTLGKIVNLLEGIKENTRKESDVNVKSNSM